MPRSGRNMMIEHGEEILQGEEDNDSDEIKDHYYQSSFDSAQISKNGN